MMHRIMRSFRRGVFAKILPWVPALFLLMTSGCLEKYGRLAPILEIDRLFEASRVLPDYHYYYAGGQNNPRAIMGVHRDYSQTNRSWTPMPALTADMLKKRVSAMTNGMGWASETYGGVIYSPAGEQVGIWYSKSKRTTIRFGENREISVGLPRWKDENQERRRPFSVP
jgi:hypothetical protein